MAEAVASKVIADAAAGAASHWGSMGLSGLVGAATYMAPGAADYVKKQAQNVLKLTKQGLSSIEGLLPGESDFDPSKFSGSTYDVGSRGNLITIRKGKVSKKFEKELNILRAITSPQYFTVSLAAATSVVGDAGKIISTDRDLSSVAWQVGTGPLIDSMDMNIVPGDVSDIYNASASSTPDEGLRVIFGHREMEYDFMNQQNTPVCIEVYLGTHKYDHYSSSAAPTASDQLLWRDLNGLIALQNWTYASGITLTNPGCKFPLGTKSTDLELVKAFVDIKRIGEFCIPAGGIQSFRFEFNTPWVDTGYRAYAMRDQQANALAHMAHLTQTLIIRYKGQVTYELSLVNAQKRSDISIAPQFLACLCRKKYTVWYNSQIQNISNSTEVTNTLATWGSTHGSMNQNVPANLASLT